MYSLAISVVRIVFMTILAFVFTASHVSAQTLMVGNDGVRYEIKEKEAMPVVKEGFTVVKQASCQLIEKTLFYRKNTCATAIIITVNNGILSKNGGVKTFKDIRFEVVVILVGMTFMAIAVVLFNFKNTAFAFALSTAFAASASAAFIAAFIATTTAASSSAFTTATFTTTFAITAAFIFATFTTAPAFSFATTAFTNLRGNKKLLFFCAVIYEVVMVLALYLIA